MSYSLIISGEKISENMVSCMHDMFVKKLGENIEWKFLKDDEVIDDFKPRKEKPSETAPAYKAVEKTIEIPNVTLRLKVKNDTAFWQMECSEKKTHMGFTDHNLKSNRLLLMAFTDALRRMAGKKKQAKLTVIAPAYITDAFNKKWLRDWRKNQWKKSDNTELVNADLWKEVSEYLPVIIPKGEMVKAISDSKKAILTAHAVTEDKEKAIEEMAKRLTEEDMNKVINDDLDSSLDDNDGPDFGNLDAKLTNDANKLANDDEME